MSWGGEGGCWGMDSAETLQYRTRLKLDSASSKRIRRPSSRTEADRGGGDPMAAKKAANLGFTLTPHESTPATSVNIGASL